MKRPLGQLAVWLLFSALFLGLFVPVGRAADDPSLELLMNLLHFPIFAVFAAGFLLLARGRVARALVWVVLVIAVVELLQPLTGRSRDGWDALFGLAGAGWALCLWRRPTVSASARRRLAAAIWLLPLLPLAPPAAWGLSRLETARSRPRIESFETPLYRLRWTASNGRMKRVRQQATSGRYALRFTANGKTDYAGCFMTGCPRDWSGAASLCWDYYNPASVPLTIVLRVDDASSQPRYGDRFQRELRLDPGAGTCCVSRQTFARTPEGRRLDMSRIRLFGFFFKQPAPGTTLFLDRIKLVKKRL